MPLSPSDTSLLLLSPPYRSLRDARVLFHSSGPDTDYRGCTLVWRLTGTPSGHEFELARARPPGVSLIVLLPSADRIDGGRDLLRIVESCRPHSILPHHEHVSLDDLRIMLTRAPEDLPMEVTDYLLWRGLTIDLDTRRLIRKTVELAGEVTTINGLARALYLSRRALGRRFTTRGLPVPSHWLHFSRVLRSSILLQDSSATLFAAANSFGYPDGFALSNQMYRLTGVRPSMVRERLGWEWILEEWIQREIDCGGFSKAVCLALRANARRAPAKTSISPPPSTLSKRPATSKARKG